MAPSLLGPPEIRAVQPPAAESAGSSKSDVFMDLMVSNFNKPLYTPPRGYTENGSATYVASGNPCLDFFFHVVPSTPPESITKRLEAAWSHDPLRTLKLVCNLRGVRGTGKSDKEGYYTAAFWLHKNHPKTLACNVPSLADFGYFKDLPEILYRLLEGSDIRKTQKAEWEQRKRGQSHSRYPHRGPFGRSIGFGIRKGNQTKSATPKPRVSKEARVLNAAKAAEVGKEKVSAARKEKKLAMARKVVDRYSKDPDFSFLHERVSDHFADCLKRDMAFVNEGKPNNISLAAKWCPSLSSSFDRSTLLCETIAKKVFPKESYAEYEGVEEQFYAYRVRDRLRREVLVPLRKILELPEVYIGQNRWDLIPYNRVASVAMKLYKEKFLKHDNERFSKYLEDVKAGNSTIAAGALLPHEIIAMLNDGDGGAVAELQWKRMVDDMLQKGKLRNCMAICDVSGSMNGTPMEVSVALGVLTSELSEDPWKGKLITFSANPQLQKVEGNDLRTKTGFVRRMELGMNTDFQKVFDLILRVAVEGNLKPDQMIKKLFVFSDMEFDAASARPHHTYRRSYSPSSDDSSEMSIDPSWETDYQVIVKKFAEKGYGDAVPQIVFWNLRDSKATPVAGNQKGVALVSGFSKNLMKLFLDHDGDIDPEGVMEAAISGEEYQKLVVID